ncbi:glycosyl hydrolase family 5 [Aminobacter sp. Y103A]|jgi:hypothetical protein|uniref:Glycosyl hydrolase family 5 n=1 Tax=Aminobacter aminovorans TaxID=83263 RepID=A0AAC9FDV8_AMIAI|nr:glycosyl hydrolase family 5 [Aminobacter aminovorans]MBB3709620.1 hypothetical protein [Aminobacter aminovorans]BBD38256.1 glycosyl hydrolase family 5 [Aminobacter sp. SS-2016]
MIFPGRIPSSGRSKAKTLLVAATLCAALGQATAQDSIERLPLDQQVEQGDDLPAIDVPPLPGEGQPAPDQAQPAPAETQAAPKVAAPPQRIKNAVAEFAGIDKITGRIITFDVYVDETVQFGALQVTPRVCYSRPENEEPKTDSFVEVDEITLDRKIRRIFTGWMFAESPGLNAVEHAVYDVWLKACKQKSDVPAPEAAKTN